MIGMVLAAGAGRRLRPYTDTLPKALVPVDGETTILDIALRNLAAVGLTDVTVVVGYRAEAVEERQAALEARHGVRLTLVYNDKAEEWNNCYSLWLAREHFARGALLVNGDTVHPVDVESTLLAAREQDGAPGILLALDDQKSLAEEEMKVVLDDAGRMSRITKLMDPSEAAGEYIGATLIEARAAEALATALKATWRAGPGPLLRGRLPDAGRHRRRDRGRTDRRRCRGSRSTTTPTSTEGTGDRVPLLARMLLSPLFIDIRAGAVTGLGDLLSDRRISADGHVAVAVGPGQGEQVVEAIRPSLGNAEVVTVGGGSLEAAGDLQAELRGKNYDALVGIGGGRTLDVAKYAAMRLGLPMVAVATNLAHDGIASPISSLQHEGGQGLVRRRAAGGCGRRPRLRAGLAAADGAVRGRRPGEQPHRRRGLAARRPRARRAGRRPRRDVRAHRGRGGAAPHRTASSRTASSRHWPKAWCCPGWR